ncbi:ANTAR domain-containing protein [Lentzea cavernae]|uniref:ANTAR domain-containing protein n=1 Tax=Lentzea cavernae TaxID=2020703 RepID=UPI00174A1827|nr:ANTAR domain-containing protein [Lentzea cavernae]
MNSHDGTDPDTELQTLRNIAVHRPVIEQAKGMVMLICSCDDPTAFTLLREISQRTNTKLHDVSAVVVAIGSNTTTELNDEVVQAVLAEARAAGLSGLFADKGSAVSDRP